MTCSVCQLERVVMLTCEQVIGRKVVRWVVCAGCWVREMREA